jgi:hypothetical protein
VANCRHRKKRIEALKGPDGVVRENKDILRVTSTFYKDMFGKEDNVDFSLVNDFWEESDKVTREKNLTLTTPFSE